MNYQRVPIAKFSNQYTVRWWFFEALTSFDADNDGDLDILVGMTGAIWDPKLSTDPKPYLIENLGNGEFKLSDFWASGSPSVAGWINNLVPGDYNEDDKIDILVVDHGREDKPYEIGDFAAPTLFLSSGAGWIETTSTIEVVNGWQKSGKDYWHGSVNSRDFNGDGHLDLVMAALGRAGVELWFGDGKGNFLNKSREFLPDYIDRTKAKLDGVWTSFGIAGFIDAGGDGKHDIFMFPYGLDSKNSNGYIVVNPISSRNSVIDLGNVAKDPRISNDSNRGYSEALVFDFDQNGLEDILALAEASNGNDDGVMYLMYLSQDTPFSFTDRTIKSFGSYSSISNKVTPFTYNNKTYYYNSPSTEFYLGDYNGDGFMDVYLGFRFLGQWDALNTTIYLNNGKGEFSRTHALQIDGSTIGTNLRTDGTGDLNQDGYADFLVISENYKNGANEYDISALISDSSDPATSFLGTELSDRIVGNSRNNYFFQTLGSDRIDGLQGTDSMQYFKPKGNFEIKASQSSLTVNSIDDLRKSDNLTSVERLIFSDGATAFDLEGVSGKSYRIYKAAFNRIPDKDGLGYWIAQMDKGMDVVTVAARFIDSPEFRSLYGMNPTDAEFLTKVYSNVLSRAPDSSGLTWWVNEMKTNPTKTWQKVLADFSESTENQANVASLIANGIEYLPWVG